MPTNASPSPPPPAPRGRPPVSRLAVVALVVALVPCCYLSGMAGAMLGIAALWRINAARGALGGRRTALAAILLGTALSVLWAGLTEHLVASREADLVETTTRRVEFVVNGPVEGAEAPAPETVWTRPPDADALAAFRRAAAERYGRLRRVSIVASSTSGLLAPTIESALVLHFDGGEQLAAARFQAHLQVPAPVYRLRGLVIEDPQRGDLRLGEPVGRDGEEAPPDVP